MPKVIVVGGSAGGIVGLCALLKDLPANIPAPVLAVIHIGEGESMLPQVFQRCTKLQVSSPTSPQPLKPGNVYVAPPGRHLSVRSGCVLAAQGPRENRHRPAIDVLFRSAARAYRSDVIAVILSGALDDGVAGCLAVEARGGKIIVQDPIDAENPEMPSNVLRQINTDYCLSVPKIASLLLDLLKNESDIAPSERSLADCQSLSQEEGLPVTEPLAFTCPECNGSLLRISNGETDQFRCNVGHIYSQESFSIAHSHAVERALWMALQRLNEQRAIQEQLAKSSKDPQLRRRYHENAAAAAEDMRLLKEILVRL
jgi:two-component system chemotaxis response regulator CheB